MNTSTSLNTHTDICYLSTTTIRNLSGSSETGVHRHGLNRAHVVSPSVRLDRVARIIGRHLAFLSPTVVELFSWCFHPPARPPDPDTMTNTALKAIALSSGKNNSAHRIDRLSGGRNY